MNKLLTLPKTFKLLVSLMGSDGLAPLGRVGTRGWRCYGRWI
jgi:hypothetical protein